MVIFIYLFILFIYLFIETNARKNFKHNAPSLLEHYISGGERRVI